MKIIPLLLFAIGTSISGQNVSFDQSDRSIMIRNGVFSESEKDSKILGSQFFTESYIDAEIVNANANVKAKYNAFKDEVEVLKDEKGFIISKIPEYKVVKFLPTNEYLELVKYYDEKGNETEGYLFQVAKKGDVVLYKKEKITLEKGRAATSSYDSDVPSKYKRQSPKYFITDEGGKILQFPDNKKRVIDLFPSKKSQIEEYIKAKKPNFSQEADVINFLKAI
ncbi:hypothetical protein NZ698_11665 [Chryseobacterium sp. PBS4-4]|uniref:GLPGLI family protein n=1 Tax=Chryseobacterium edaphi TaxID=2976532 RepID=A0ABT2W7C0_9FLAO|nr:hypothetical protein [Chryseobacterium edaphi]MCU7617858.1 hypothetical protein [Chryseobacterium edaphi]